MAIGFALFLLWAMLAQVDEVTAGQGKVIPSSKVQLIQASEPATISRIDGPVRASGSPRANCWRRLDNPQSRQIQAETEALEARSARLASEGLGGGIVPLAAKRRR